MQHVLRIVRVVRGLGSLEFRTLVQLGQIVLDDAKELVQRTTRAVLHNERHTTIGRETRNHRRCKGQNLCILDVCRLDENLSDDTRCTLWVKEETVDTIALPQSAELPEEAMLTLREWFQLDDERSLVRTRTGNEVIALNLLTVLDGRVGSQNAVHLTDDLLGALY